MRVIFAAIFKSILVTLIFLIPSMEGRSQTEPYTWGNVALGGGGFVSGIIGHKTSGDVYCRTDVGGAYRWDAANSKWIPLLDWCSEDEVTYQGVEALALDPQDPNKVYILAGTEYFNYGKTAILKSSDKGKTFTIIDVTANFKAHGNGQGRGTGEKLAVDPNNGNILFCGTRKNGLWKSTDAGVTWTLAWNGVTTTSNNNGISFVIFDPNSASGGISQNIYIGISRLWSTNVYRSTDGGKTFSELSATLPTNFMPNRAVISGNILYLAYGNGSGPDGITNEPMNDGKVLKFNTSTSTVTDITPPTKVAYAGITVDPKNSNRIVVSSSNAYFNDEFGTSWGDFIYMTTDGGNTWTNKLTHDSKFNTNGLGWMAYNSGIHWGASIEFDPLIPSKVRITSGNGLFTCDNIDAAPTTWKPDVKGMEETVVLDAISIPGGNFISAVGDQYGAVYSDIYAYPAKNHHPTVVTNNGIAYAVNNTNKVVRATNKLYYSNDQGQTWIATDSTVGGYGKVALSGDGNTILHCPGGSSTTYYSTDNGTTWASTGVTNAQDAAPQADYVNGNKFYIYSPGTGQLFVSTNKGVSFTASASNPGQYGSPRARSVPGNEGHVWVALYGSGLKYTTNSGTSWTTVSKVSDCAAVGFGKAAPGKTYPAVYIWGTVGGVRGMFRSIDQGANWVRINDDAHEWGGVGNGKFIMGDLNVYGRVYMCTVGRGLLAGEAPKYTLTTTASPSAGGTVSGAGTYVSGTVVTVTATPAAGYTFTGWSGDASGTATSVTVTMTSNKSVTANFQAIKYTLTTTATPAAGGTVSGGGSYTAGATATITATPAAGYTFTGWSGDASGTATSVTITMNSNKSVTANFQAIKYTLATTATPAAGGTVSGGGSYTAGATATITATPAAGYTFTGWSGDASGTATSVTITMNSNKSVTANFQAIKYTLATTATPAAGGTVSGGGSYTAGATATITATPAAGYTFTGWSGDASGTATSVTVTMNSNKSVTANFQAIKYTLATTATPAAGGTVSGGGFYTAGTTATLTATPATGYAFTGWSGDASGTSATTTVTMNGDKSVTATFQLIQPGKYTLTTTSSPAAGGTISGGGSYTSGSTATLTATPAAGYTFTGWGGDATGTATTISVTMNSDKSVTANFQAIKYTLTTTAVPSAGGNINGAGTYDAGTIVNLTATPAAGYTFTGWSGDASGTATSITVTMTGNKSVTANFQAESGITTYTLSVTAVPTDGGFVTGAGTYSAGTEVTITAQAAAGYTFSGWSGDVSGTVASQTVTLNNDMAVQAIFERTSDVVLKIPKLFSPDNRGDVSTEAWNIENAYLLDGCEIVIYNRQGQKVYSSLGYATPWDGSSNGKPLPDGAYFYIIRYTDNTKQTGSVTIARLK
ncbi:InlB B-repeat-containing protein [Ohtaekwangia sp.]|uniref:InlB B-repeat-containing protein n=1 Tax=Ohtaekwangia sp. TaxID=2066019 RepID=UPI002FDD26C8